MFIITNALKNLKRNYGRNILIGIVLFAIITASVVGVIINNTTDKIISDYKNRFGTKVIISPDIQKFRELKGNTTGMLLTTDMLLKFANSNYVKSSDLMNEAGVGAVDFKEMDIEVQGSSQNFGGNVEEAGFPTAKLRGFSSPNLMTEFENGSRKIINGKMFSEKGECIISEDLAEKNKLSIGDKLTLKWVQPINGQQLSMTIVGIYYDTNSKYGDLGDIQFPYLNKRNEILANFETVQDGFPYSEVKIAYYLKAPSDLIAFENEMRSEGLPSTFYAKADMETYNKIISPVEGLKNVSVTFLLIILILGSFVLIFISAIVIRERKYEIGVLRAMGMKKFKLIIGFITEIFVITLVCLCLGIFIGTTISKPIGNELLKQQLINSNSNDNSDNNSGMKLEAFDEINDTNVDFSSEFKLLLDFNSLIYIILISMLLAGISCITSISAVIKHEPMKILMGRD